MTLKDDLTKTEKGLLAWHQERSILETTEMICKIMKEKNISRSELAKALGTTRVYLSQILSGSKDMTLRHVSDIFTKLGYEFHPSCSKIEGEVE